MSMYASDTEAAIAATGFQFDRPASIMLVFPHIGVVPEVHVNAVGDELIVFGVVLRHPHADSAMTQRLVHQHGYSRLTAENLQQPLSQGWEMPQIWHTMLDEVVYNVAQVQASQCQELCRLVGFDFVAATGRYGVSPATSTADEMLAAMLHADAELTRKLVDRRLDIVQTVAMDVGMMDEADSHIPADEVDAMMRTVEIARKLINNTATPEEKNEALAYVRKYHPQAGL